MHAVLVCPFLNNTWDNTGDAKLLPAIVPIKSRDSTDETIVAVTEPEQTSAQQSVSIDIQQHNLHQSCKPLLFICFFHYFPFDFTSMNREQTAPPFEIGVSVWGICTATQ